MFRPRLLPAILAVLSVQSSIAQQTSSSSANPLDGFISIAQSVGSALAPKTTSSSSSSATSMSSRASSTSSNPTTSSTTLPTTSSTFHSTPASSAAAAQTSAPAGHGLSNRNKTIIIAVCAVVGALLLGILIGCICCCLRRRKRRARRTSIPEAAGIRGGDWEKGNSSHHGFSHWNGRRVENYTPIASGNNHVPIIVPEQHRGHSPRPSDADHPAFRGSTAVLPASPTEHNVNNGNPFVPHPPPARKPVGSPPGAPRGRHHPGMAAGLGALAGAAAARHHERNKKDRAPYHEYETGFENQPLNSYNHHQGHQPSDGYDAHQERQPLNGYNANPEAQPLNGYGIHQEPRPSNNYDANPEQQPLAPYNDRPDSYDNMQHAPEQTAYDPIHSERDPNRPPTPFGLATFSSPQPRNTHQPPYPGATEPTASSHPHEYAQHHIPPSNPHSSTATSTAYTSSSTSDAHSSFPDSHPGFYPPTAAQRRSLSERDMASPAQEPLYVHPPVPERSPKRASFLEASSRGSSSQRLSQNFNGQNSPLIHHNSSQSPLASYPPETSGENVPAVPATAAAATATQAQGPGHEKNRNGRMSFSRPRPRDHEGYAEAYDPRHSHHSQAQFEPHHSRISNHSNEQQSSSGDSWGNAATPSAMPGGWMETPGLEQPSVPWNTVAGDRRSGSSERRSLGPDGLPRRLRRGDFVEEGGFQGVGQAL
ncbi:MAG: hypothetical protein MMC23_001721 [Stictis urceolatum]|nr:hypothetical protein [Stictis urceolata]